MIQGTEVRPAVRPAVRPPVRAVRPGVLDIRRVGARRTVAASGRVVAGTARTCLRYRVTGLAAEAGFFALLSLPPLMLGLVASAGFAARRIGNGMLDDLEAQIAQITGTFLTPDAVRSVIVPTFDEVLRGGRLEIVSIGFLLSLWSGSRALNVYVDTVSIMYGLGGHRGIVRTRALSFSLYVLSLLIGVVVVPLLLVGPGLLSEFLSTRVNAITSLGSLTWLGVLYWPVVVVLTVAGVTTLYHLSTPVRTPWRRDLPGAALALLVAIGASALLRVLITDSVGGTSIYGPLAAPIVVLIWLYLLAIAVLIGAALNATLDDLWPDPARAAARARPAAHAGERPVTPDPRRT